MINQKEIIAIVVATLILGFTISLLRSPTYFLYSLLAIFLVIMINIIAKKIASYWYEAEIDVKLWEIRRFGYRPHWHLKKPFPIGVFLPIVVTALSVGYLNWFAPLVFDVKAKTSRAAKRHGYYSYTEMSEMHIARIAAMGIAANLIFAIIGYLAGFPLFARLNIYFAFCNMIPLSTLDGNKVFFGNFVLWCFLAVLAVIGLIYALVLV